VTDCTICSLLCYNATREPAESSRPHLMKTSLDALVSVRGVMLAADRRISNLIATEVKRLGVSNGGSELGDFLCRYSELN